MHPPFCYDWHGMDKELVFVRHARQNTKACNLDVPLSAEGRRQALLLASRLEGEHFDSLYTSDLTRARETAEIINSKLSLPVITRTGLREIDWGDLTGMMPAEYQKKDSDHDGRKRCLDDYRFPGGESGDDVFNRLKPVIEEMIESDAERILVVTHGGTIRTLVCGLIGIPMRFRLAFGASLENTSLTVFRYDSRLDIFTLERFNDASHLMVDTSLFRANW